ncbi:MAG: hypothetical protein HY553_21115 [Elusimicrobia bacterium]|nr:hypothetical protein [Elusimicrobiota bacterium]
MKQEFWDGQFELGAKSAVAWVLQARRLKRAADLVFEAYVNDLREMQNGRSPLELNNLQTVGPATLLYGVAFENMFKALIVKNQGVVVDQGRLANWPRTHKLITLAGRAGIVLTAVQRDLLSRFTAFVEWSGRYPIPMSRDEMPLKQDAVSPEWLPLPLQPHELTLVHEFFLALDGRVLDAHGT